MARAGQGDRVGVAGHGRDLLSKARAAVRAGGSHWVFAIDVDATYDELQFLGANIVDPLETKPWGLRQFTVEDLDGNRFYFHHD